MLRDMTLALVIALAAGVASGAQDTDTKAARTSIDTWLALIDEGSYAASWETAATGFRAAITSQMWQGAVRAARAPLGQLKARTLKSTTTTTTLPGAPDGEYVVFQFNTTFEQRAAAVETVTAAKDKDGTWRVAGYYIK